jgi:hypothetical protein
MITSPNLDQYGTKEAKHATTEIRGGDIPWEYEEPERRGFPSVRGKESSKTCLGKVLLDARDTRDLSQAGQ